MDILRFERAEDIICIKVPVSDTRDRYVIICTPHNMRHGEAIVLAIRKCFKLKTSHQVCFASVLLSSWFSSRNEIGNDFIRQIL